MVWQSNSTSTSVLMQAKSLLQDLYYVYKVLAKPHLAKSSVLSSSIHTYTSQFYPAKHKYFSRHLCLAGLIRWKMNTCMQEWPEWIDISIFSRPTVCTSLYVSLCQVVSQSVIQFVCFFLFSGDVAWQLMTLLDFWWKSIPISKMTKKVKTTTKMMLN